MTQLPNRREKVARNFQPYFVYADCPYMGTEDYYENVFTDADHNDLASMLESHKGSFVLSSKAKKELRKLYHSNKDYLLEFEDTSRLPDKRHREQLIMNFEVKYKKKIDKTACCGYNVFCTCIA